MSHPRPVSGEYSSRPHRRDRADLWPNRMLEALRGAVAVVFLGDLAL